jgi:hypothetical protein
LSAFQNLPAFPRRFPILNLADSHHCKSVAYEAPRTAYPKRGFVG